MITEQGIAMLRTLLSMSCASLSKAAAFGELMQERVSRVSERERDRARASGLLSIAV